MWLILFWSALIFIIYTLILFPVLIVLRGLIWPMPYRCEETTPLPKVSLIIAAYNEGETIAAKLENIASLDYPRDRLEVVIASDGSTDTTVEIVQRFLPLGIRLLALPRVGKAEALNAAVAVATGDILVFSDANSIYAADALRKLVQPFADPHVGGVAGNQRYIKSKDKLSSSEGEHFYWGFDRLLKRYQSQSGNTISATGAIYAIRHVLFLPIPAGVTDDFVTSTRVITQGYRLVFMPDAVAFEPASSSSHNEFKRKVRLITRGLYAVLMMRQLLNPIQYGFYSIQVFSHKVLRRLLAYPLALLWIANLALLNRGWFYQICALLQLVFYALALIGLLAKNHTLGAKKLFSFPFYFCMANIASLVATFNVVRGYRIDRWEPQRERVPAEAEGQAAIESAG